MPGAASRVGGLLAGEDDEDLGERAVVRAPDGLCGLSRPCGGRPAVMQELVYGELLREPLSEHGGEVDLDEPLAQDRIAVGHFQIAEQRVGDQPLLLAALAR